MADYIPQSEHKRHQLYIGAFSRTKSRTEYYAYITQFLFDPEISPENDEDIAIFSDLLLESSYGKVHIDYYNQFILSLKYKKKINLRRVRRLARYAHYLSKVNSSFLEDMYHVVYRSDVDVVAQFLEELPNQIRWSFIRLAERYPDVIWQVPKIKLYMTFS